MTRWLVSLSVFLFVCLITIGYLYQYGGLQQYIRAVSLVKSVSPQGDQLKVYDDFYGTDPRGAKHGILAGIWLNKVWVWTEGWLKSYKTDQYTVYSWFDGCNAETREKLNQGISNVILQNIYTNIQDWRRKANVGDYVTVYVAAPENGGVAGNLREIYDYNFWHFLGRKIDIECEK